MYLTGATNQKCVTYGRADLRTDATSHLKMRVVNTIVPPFVTFSLSFIKLSSSLSPWPLLNFRKDIVVVVVVNIVIEVVVVVAVVDILLLIMMLWLLLLLLLLFSLYFPLVTEPFFHVTLCYDLFRYIILRLFI